MSCALGTAYRSVVTRGGVRAGMTAAIVGLGGVGIHAAQIARAAGARTWRFDLDARAINGGRRTSGSTRAASDDPRDPRIIARPTATA